MKKPGQPNWGQQFQQQVRHQQQQRRLQGGYVQWKKQRHKQGLKGQRNSARTHFLLGRACYEQGDLKGAIAAFGEALRCDPNHPDLYYWRGYVRGEKDDLKGAIADFNEALRLDPGLVAIYCLRGTCRRDLGDLKGAIADYKKYLDTGGARKHGDEAQIKRMIKDLKTLLKSSRQ